jgi:hypothetical protein
LILEWTYLGFNRVAGTSEEKNQNNLYKTLPATLQIAPKEKLYSFCRCIARAPGKLVDTCFWSEIFRIFKQRDLHKKLNLWRFSAGTAGTREDDSHATRVKKLEESKFYRKENIYRDGANGFPPFPQPLTVQKSSNGLGRGANAILSPMCDPQNDKKTLQVPAEARVVRLYIKK